MIASSQNMEIKYPQLAADHDREVHVSNPTWRDVPEVQTVSQKEVREIVIETIEGVFNNGATKRCEVITEVAYHYRRYRKTCCTPKRSRIEATKRAAEKLKITQQAVRGHLETLRMDEGYTDPIVNCLEQVNLNLAALSSPLSIQLHKTCERLVRVLDEIVAIDQTPSIEPTDIRIEDVKMDRPGKRTRILDTEYDVIGVSNDCSASYSDPILDRQMPIEGEGTSEFFTEGAKIRPRDIATYNTDYSHVIRKVFNAVQAEMRLRGKQKTGPVISTDGDDNSAVRAVLPFPETIDSNVPFAHISVRYWESGESDVSVTTRPDPDMVYDELDPRLSGPIDSVSKPSIHTLIGETLEAVECLN